jgi:hypothetical protein
MKNLFLNSLVLILIICSCSGTTERPSLRARSQNSTENFDVFIKKFKNDTIFRKSRILYPLKGYNSDDIEESLVTNKKINYEWKTKMLNYYLDKNYPENQYKTEIEKSQDQVKETILIEGSGFKIISKYILKEKKWYLNYYFYQNE